ncbi:MAG: ribonuclease HI family protein [Methanomassiliicoccales archaeon]|nr:ribonuclease HI family protein [Methanomassiliicoccales archaeon]NYT15640.1 ribonuclease HI family protein [Methanomassiliicoccales archaeon]
MKVKLYSDGGARGNPGDAAYAYIICAEDGRITKESSRYIGFSTNNEAEYSGLLAGLEDAWNLGALEVEVIMDSELVIKQMRKEYRVKARNLKPYYDEVVKRVKDFEKVTFTHVKRDDPMISRADTLLNQELDDHELLKKIKKS